MFTLESARTRSRDRARSRARAHARVRARARAHARARARPTLIRKENKWGNGDLTFSSFATPKRRITITTVGFSFGRDIAHCNL